MSLNPDPDEWNLGKPWEWALWAVGFVLTLILSQACPGAWFA